MIFNRHLIFCLAALSPVAFGCDLEKSIGGLDESGGANDSKDTQAADTYDDEDTGTACTLEALVCPDGSAVGRIGPNCEFAPCPGEGTTSAGGGSEEPVPCTGDARLCADGTSVGREGPNCEFAPCPGECDPGVCKDPVPDVAFAPCDDGSLAGAFCMPDEAGECDWQIRQCPPSVCTLEVFVCPDGTEVGRDPNNNCEFPACPGVCEGEAVQYEPAACPNEEGSLVLPVRGCYVPCANEGELCADGTTCTRVQYNPCACPPIVQEACCDACGAETFVCLTV